MESAAPDDGAKERKRFQVGENTEALAKAVSSLAPTNEEVKSKMEWMTASKVEQKKKVELLTYQTNHEKNQEKWDFHSWRRSECERYLFDTLPQEMKAKLEAKMSQLAEEVFDDNVGNRDLFFVFIIQFENS